MENALALLIIFSRKKGERRLINCYPNNSLMKI